MTPGTGVVASNSLTGDFCTCHSLKPASFEISACLCFVSGLKLSLTKLGGISDHYKLMTQGGVLWTESQAGEGSSHCYQHPCQYNSGTIR